MWTDLKCWRWVIVWLVLAKVVYLAATWLAVRLWSDFDREKSHEINARWFNAENQQSPEFITHFSTWDGAHSLYLSQNGYQNGVRSCAFYPLWPLAIREVSILTGGTHLMTGMVL